MANRDESLLSTVRTLREAQWRAPVTAPTAAGETLQAYGVVVSVDADATPPLHGVVLAQGPTGGLSGKLVECVAPMGATLPMEATVRVVHMPGVGLVAELIADQTGAGGTVANHSHSNANGDGGETVHGFSY